MVKWHFNLSPLCLMLSFPTVKDEISSPIPQVQKKAPLCRLRCHFRLWKGNKSCYCQGCYWEHRALSPTGLAIVKRLKQSCLPWISSLWLAQLGSPPPLPNSIPFRMPQNLFQDKLKFLLLSDLQTMQIFSFLSLPCFKKRKSVCWMILVSELQRIKPLKRSGRWSDQCAGLEDTHKV